MKNMRREAVLAAALLPFLLAGGGGEAFTAERGAMPSLEGTFKVAASKTDFPEAQENPIRVWIDLGGQTFRSEEDWTENAKKAGNYKYP